MIFSSILQIAALTMKKRYTFFLMGEILNENFENEVTFGSFNWRSQEKKIGKVIRFLYLVAVNSQKYNG
jgi:hypothetical protein